VVEGRWMDANTNGGVIFIHNFDVVQHLFHTKKLLLLLLQSPVCRDVVSAGLALNYTWLVRLMIRLRKSVEMALEDPLAHWGGRTSKSRSFSSQSSTACLFHRCWRSGGRGKTRSICCGSTRRRIRSLVQSCAQTESSEQPRTSVVAVDSWGDAVRCGSPSSSGTKAHGRATGLRPGAGKPPCVPHQGRLDFRRVGHALRSVGERCGRSVLVKGVSTCRHGPAECLAKRVERARRDLDRCALLCREWQEVGKNGRLWLHGRGGGRRDLGERDGRARGERCLEGRGLFV